ncbi:unnamed protein product [Schistosoma rodhaini]|uniref:Uncharacterized protein n=1 Tax=Schistosoma rodhaini TaxID=6188 RepID=A0AA85FBX9_9TREM|nr:unnamed protein product [Schistosoma rodhaini]
MNRFFWSVTQCTILLVIICNLNTMKAVPTNNGTHAAPTTAKAVGHTTSKPSPAKAAAPNTTKSPAPTTAKAVGHTTSKPSPSKPTGSSTSKPSPAKAVGHTTSKPSPAKAAAPNTVKPAAPTTKKPHDERAVMAAAAAPIVLGVIGEVIGFILQYIAS